MNISPISFKGVTKIVGFRPQACADRICDLINHQEKGENRAEQKIVKYFNSRKTDNQATSISFNKGASAYVVTGEHYDDLKGLYEDMAEQVKIARDIYGQGSDMVKLVQEAELDRYNDLAKLVVLEEIEGTLRVGMNDTTNHINAVDLMG
ncbi:MAG: hypothetical protein IKL52_06665 [Candidatus Gastranaerophilales bacterium]|nr:hypothetical protein [Candidatus Gastranaerophilales bacterium]